jgi:hypothetical protein
MALRPRLSGYVSYFQLPRQLVELHSAATTGLSVTGHTSVDQTTGVKRCLKLLRTCEIAKLHIINGLNNHNTLTIINCNLNHKIINTISRALVLSSFNTLITIEYGSMLKLPMVNRVPFTTTTGELKPHSPPSGIRILVQDNIFKLGFKFESSHSEEFLRFLMMNLAR